MLDILVDVLLDTLGEIMQFSSRRNKKSGRGRGENVQTTPSSQAGTRAQKNAGAPRSAFRPARAKRRRKDRGKDAIEVLRVGR
ncbi:MAG: hypothetical protein JW741_25995 [Sedimentisphaerales bacterium]|nr:hypothetical protein [Sedimentisphaerales bacterium]